MFSRIAVVNRGEAAMRLINAVADLRADGDEPAVIALYTHAERTALFVREADEAFEISSPHGSPYLDYEELERVLRACDADAVWVGWGFVAEHADFADLCARLGIVFIGPSGDVMRLLGDKIGSKLLAEQSGVPVAAWSGGAVTSIEQAREAAGEIGYPLMVKATSGGGGRGIRKVERESELADAIERAQSEGEKSFGDPTVFMEKVVDNARHIEVQIAADNNGHAWALGVRDCSVQRRNQKIIEESHSPVLTAAQEAEIGGAAVRLAQAADYRNVGTVEFLYQPETGDFAFLEVNTRLQVEHPVTEATTGVDLVRLQLQIAAGWSLAGDSPAKSGHAIEARLNAEDADQGFTPAPGRIDVLRFAGGPGVRIDSGFAEGDVIPADFDSMIAKIIAVGATRTEARHRLRRALTQTTVVIEGGVTNKSFVVQLLDRPEFISGDIDTAWLDRALDDGTLRSDTAGADIALLATAIEAWQEADQMAQGAFYVSAARGRPNIDAVPARSFEVRSQGERYAMTVSRLSPSLFRVVVDGHVITVEAERMGAVELRLTVAGNRHRVVLMSDGADTLAEVDGITHRVSLDDGGAIRAPAPSLVVSVLASEGEIVTRGTPLVVVEAMKVETTLNAPFDGTVTAVLTSPNMQVDAGEPLIKLEPATEEDEAGAVGERVAFAPLEVEIDPSEQPRQRCLDLLSELRWFVLGFERPSDSLDRLRGEYRRVRNALSQNDAALARAEVAVMRAFADVVGLSRNRPADEVLLPETHSPQEYFHRYLRALEPDAEGLSTQFQAKLANAFAHYGIDLDDESVNLADLRQAAHGIFKGQQQAGESASLILEILSTTPPEPSTFPDDLVQQLRETLTSLAIATQRRFPAVGDAARTYTFVAFDKSALETARESALQSARAALSSLVEASGSADRPTAMGALVTSPYRLIRLLNDRNTDGTFADRETLIEVLTRRNYLIRNLEEFRLGEIEGRRILTVGYQRQAERFNVIASLCDAEDFVTTAAATSSVAVHAPSTDNVVVDIYVRWDRADVDVDQLSVQLGLDLVGAKFPANVLRVAVSGVTADGRVLHFTYRHVAGQLSEDVAVRGMHPMIAQRLQLGRLTNFDVERLDSPDDTYLFKLVGRENSDDVRLLAAAEIRDFSMVRDAAGRVIDLPEVTRKLTVTLDGMRAYRNARPSRERPLWNRVVLYVWPVVDVPVEDFKAIASRLAPLTANLGLEEVRVQAKVANADGEPEEVVVRISEGPGGGIDLNVAEVPTGPMQPLDAYTQKLLAARRRGFAYPYEIVPMLVRDKGTFVEYDLIDSEADPGQQVFAKVERPAGQNSAGVVVGLVSTASQRYPEGMTRVAILGDPTKALGTVAEAECMRILGAIDLADMLDIPVEWFALSSGAKIAMDSGTENMDWISRVLRRIINFTQAGGEINVIVTGINVGAQPYWNAEATMLMHTKGILVMTPESAMVLTGKQALDYSGGVSAEDNFGIGGFDRIMGPNGQAQYWAPDLKGAVDVLFAHYDHSYVARNEKFPRAAATTDPEDRDVRNFPHVVDGLDFTTVGDVFSDEANPGRKKPFDIRTVMTAVADQDHAPLERWAPMRDAETVVVFDAHLGGHPISLVGVESRPMDRHGRLPADGPDQWTAGTLFPLSSKKMARAINAASGSRPLVVLANLSGFDGSPESLSRLQLEFGAEIGRAVVNFDGPIVFCVVSRFHGGAFVVFSSSLHDNMQVLAVEGTHASVLGGAPAAAVVFAGDVRRRVDADPRIVELEARIKLAANAEAAVALRSELADLRVDVHSEKLGDVANEFDSIHSIDRALAVGSVDHIVPAEQLRPRLISAIKVGMSRVTGEPYEEPDWPQPFEAAVSAVVPMSTDYTPPRDEGELVHWLDDVPGFITEDSDNKDGDTKHGDTEDSDTERSDTERSDTEDSDTEDSDTDAADGSGEDGHGVAAATSGDQSVEAAGHQNGVVGEPFFTAEVTSQTSGLQSPTLDSLASARPPATGPAIAASVTDSATVEVRPVAVPADFPIPEMRVAPATAASAAVPPAGTAASELSVPAVAPAAAVTGAVVPPEDAPTEAAAPAMGPAAFFAPVSNSAESGVVPPWPALLDPAESEAESPAPADAPLPSTPTQAGPETTVPETAGPQTAVPVDAQAGLVDAQAGPASATGDDVSTAADDGGPALDYVSAPPPSGPPLDIPQPVPMVDAPAWAEGSGDDEDPTEALAQVAEPQWFAAPATPPDDDVEAPPADW